MIARLNAYEPMDFPVPTPGFLGDDSAPDISNTLQPVDLSQFTDVQPLAPLDYSALSPLDASLVDNLPSTWSAPPDEGLNLLDPAVAAQYAGSVQQPSFLQSLSNWLNIGRPATAIAASSIASGAVNNHAAPAAPSTGVAASMSKFLTAQTLLPGHSNSTVLFLSAGALLLMPMFIGVRGAISPSTRRRRK